MIGLIIKSLGSIIVFTLFHPEIGWNIYGGTFKTAAKLLGFVAVHPLRTRNALKTLRTPSKEKYTQVTYEKISTFQTKDKNLAVSKYVQHDALAIQNLSNEINKKSDDKLDYCKNSFKWVRDNIKFGFSPDQSALGALTSRRGICYGNLNLLAALCRAQGIPARFKYTSINVERNITEFMGLSIPTDAIEIYYLLFDFILFSFPHAMLELYINGEWIEADPVMTPEFSAALEYPVQHLGDSPAWNLKSATKYIYTSEIPVVMMDIVSHISNKLFADIVNANYDIYCETGKEILSRYENFDEYNKHIRRRYNYAKM
jgi:hypothetical protein